MKLAQYDDGKVRSLVRNGAQTSKPERSEYVLLRELTVPQWIRVVDIFSASTQLHNELQDIVNIEIENGDLDSNAIPQRVLAKIFPENAGANTASAAVMPSSAEGSAETESSVPADTGDASTGTAESIMESPVFDDDSIKDMTAENETEVPMDASVGLNDEKKAEEIAEHFYGLPTRKHLKKAYGIKMPTHMHIPFIRVGDLSEKDIDKFDLETLENVNKAFYGKNYDSSPAKKFIVKMKQAQEDIRSKRLTTRFAAPNKFNNALKAYSCLCTFDIDLEKTNFAKVEKWARAKYEGKDNAKWEKYKKHIERFQAIQKGNEQPTIDDEKELAEFLLDYVSDVNKDVFAKDKDLKNLIDLTLEPMNQTIQNLSIGYINAALKYAFQPQGFILATLSIGGVPVIAIAGGLIIATAVTSLILKRALKRIQDRKKNGNLEKAQKKAKGLKRGKGSDKINGMITEVMSQEAIAQATRRQEKKNQKDKAKKAARDKKLDEFATLLGDRTKALDGKGLAQKLTILKTHAKGADAKEIMGIVSDNVTYKMAAVIRYNAEGELMAADIKKLDNKITKYLGYFREKDNQKRLKPTELSEYRRKAQQFGELIAQRNQLYETYSNGRKWARELSGVNPDGTSTERKTVDDWIRDETAAAIQCVKDGKKPVKLYDIPHKWVGKDYARFITQKVLEKSGRFSSIEEIYKALEEKDAILSKKAKRIPLTEKQIAEQAQYSAEETMASTQKRRDQEVVKTMTKAATVQEKEENKLVKKEVRKIKKEQIKVGTTRATGAQGEKKITDPALLAIITANKMEKIVDTKNESQQRIGASRTKLYGDTNPMKKSVQKQRQEKSKKETALIVKNIEKIKKKEQRKINRQKRVDKFKRVPEFVKGAVGKVFSPTKTTTKTGDASKKGGSKGGRSR